MYSTFRNLKTRWNSNPSPSVIPAGPAAAQAARDVEYQDVDVAIVMESTYPYLKGGVSAVVHDIVTHNPDLSYGIIHITWDSSAPLTDLYGMPANVRWVRTVFLSMEQNRDDYMAVSDQDLGMDPNQP